MTRRSRTMLIASALVLVSACRGSLQLEPSDADVVLARQLLNAPNPGVPGPHQVRTLYYGSGTDRRRAEYRDSVSFRTSSVDASKLVSLGDQAKSRNDYWGFTPREFPINGRVWYPVGDGPFPLVLIVHGNHDMKDYSDPGYGYLGELLASRGFIMTSVDMNFVNGGIRGENDGRGWLLLKHVQAWKGFANDSTNPFFGKVDFDKIALIGHSRGGEAVAHAAAFNQLTHYPDDASLTFEFGFGIQSVIAIAPVDGQYLPSGRSMPVENVNYLVVHGSHDGDVTSFHGLRQYHRVTFTDGQPRFKAAVYVYRANHGQWNTVWGNHDNGRRSGRILELAGLLDPEDQRTFGKVYIGAFLEATLHGDKRYLPMFRDHRVIGQWLPKTMYVTRFETSGFEPIATFEEDIDVTTGTLGDVVIRGESLATWREDRLALRSRNRPNTSASQDNQAVWLGWNNRRQDGDSSVTEAPGRYTLTLPARLPFARPLNGQVTLDFLVAPTNQVPPPRRATGDSTSQSRGEDRAGRDRGRHDRDEKKPPIDLTVEIQDAEGNTARLPASRYAALRRPLEIRILRRGDIERSRFEEPFELLLQSISILLDDFRHVNPAVDVTRLRSISFVFDRTEAGTVVLDDVGLSWLDPAFVSIAMP